MKPSLVHVPTAPDDDDDELDDDDAEDEVDDAELALAELPGPDPPVPLDELTPAALEDVAVTALVLPDDGPLPPPTPAASDDVAVPPEHAATARGRTRHEPNARMLAAFLAEPFGCPPLWAYSGGSLLPRAL
jgi:hypothetical protein